MTEVPLSRPVQAHGEELRALTLREPTGADIVACGVPYRILIDDHAGQSVAIDAAAMAKMIARLAGVPPSSVQQLTAQDWTAAMTAVLGFFGAGATP